MSSTKYEYESHDRYDRTVHGYKKIMKFFIYKMKELLK